MRGLFGRHQSPQRIFEAQLRDLFSSLREDPGLRLAETTTRSSGTYTGGALAPQTFVRPPTGPNDNESLRTAPIAINARRALSRGRGAGWEV